ncbi:DUF72 domain-containing protein [Thalassoroseus pseudoceratinae]|uniref:DUF72 domain-containing protein n=1 Tax=Thalassoroseus pseudoceratinae TaxID=2713176 RepID=UPI00141EF6CA|nr:DUF72 domain-containing protein [Thalassoroseus pseudoceratinae]
MPYHIGCPVWANSRWNGTLYSRSATRDDYLPQYSSVFNTVEVNSTFYGLPAQATALRWAESVALGFRFATKFPKDITHERRLSTTKAETSMFIELLETFRQYDCLGPSFLQLPPTFSGSEFPKLQRFIEEWPAEFPLAVEVRHRDYFDDGPIENGFEKLLRERQFDRVLLDSRPLYSAPATDESEARSQTRKPNVPFRTSVTGSIPFVRFIGRNQLERVQPWVAEWAPVVADWIESGLTPYIFLHTPDDFFAPELARRFHQELSKYLPTLPDLASWPGERDDEAGFKQKRLF